MTNRMLLVGCHLALLFTFAGSLPAQTITDKAGIAALQYRADHGDAKAQYEIGKVEEAKVTFDKLFANKRLPELGEIYWLSLHERGRISLAEGDPKGAIEFWRRAAVAIEEQRSSINTEASKIGFVGDKQAVYAGLIAALIQQGRVVDPELDLDERYATHRGARSWHGKRPRLNTGFSVRHDRVHHHGQRSGRLGHSHGARHGCDSATSEAGARSRCPQTLPAGSARRLL